MKLANSVKTLKDSHKVGEPFYHVACLIACEGESHDSLASVTPKHRVPHVFRCSHQPAMAAKNEVNKPTNSQNPLQDHCKSFGSLIPIFFPPLFSNPFSIPAFHLSTATSCSTHCKACTFLMTKVWFRKGITRSRTAKLPTIARQL